jgi:hypothetical protein
MVRILISLLLILSTSAAWAGQQGNPSEAPSTPQPLIAAPPLPIGTIKSHPVIEGCTCEFQQPNARVKGSPDLVFLAGAGWEPAWVHIDEDIALKKVSAPMNLPNKKGERQKILLIGPNQLKVELDLTVGNVCPASQPCDTVGFDGLMNVSRGAQKATTIIVGQCGC